MSLAPFALSPDLQELRDEGYTVDLVETAYVLIRDVAYVTPSGVVAHDGVLAYPYSESGPADHVAYFAGERPSKRDGSEFNFVTASNMLVADGLTVQYQLSAKDEQQPIDPDYGVKFRRYLTLLGDQAEGLEPGSSTPPHRPVRDQDPDSPFEYLDSASSRAGIVKYAKRLEDDVVALVGLGGTGSYILDFVSKTRVREIHVFDADTFLSHNAFRAPGAASFDELQQRQSKVGYFAAKYGVMKRKIIAHPYAVTEANVDQLAGMTFVFLAMEGGTVKRQLTRALENMGLPFIDASLDVLEMGDGLGGTVQVTTSTQAKRDHLQRRVDFSDPDPDDIYSSNVQVADLNALNAVMAVIKWKKSRGFYADLRREHWSAYGIDQNMLISAEEA